jgi:hypothetical protein
MDECNPCHTPMDTNTTFSQDMDKETAILEPYREAIGSLLYLAILTRPDISFPVNVLSRFNLQPKKAHWNAVKRIFRYLKGTITDSLHFNKSIENGFIIKIYADADLGGDPDTGKSTSGYTIHLNDNLIIWSTKKQNSVSLSTTEAELTSLSTSIIDGLWMKKFIDEVLDEDVKIQIYNDNLSTIKYCKNEKNQSRMKHLHLKQKFILQKLNSSKIFLDHISTDKMIADILTKALPQVKIKYFKEQLQLS